MYGSPMYYPTPAMQTAQQRLQMMESQYPQFASNPNAGYPQQPVQAQPVVKGRPVSNEEEANAAMIDFDGSLFVFPDRAHGKIYTKQLGLDGNIIFCRYAMEQPTPMAQPQQSPTGFDPNTYATKDELLKGLEEIRSYLTQQLEQLTAPKGGLSE